MDQYCARVLLLLFKTRVCWLRALTSVVATPAIDGARGQRGEFLD